MRASSCTPGNLIDLIQLHAVGEKLTNAPSARLPCQTFLASLPSCDPQAAELVESNLPLGTSRTSPGAPDVS